jgi:hypothetical protein
VTGGYKLEASHDNPLPRVEKLKGRAKTLARNQRTEKQKSYTINIPDMVPMAQCVVSKPQIRVPKRIFAIIDQTIHLRRKLTNIYCHESMNDPKANTSNITHSHFTDVLKSVYNILLPSSSHEELMIHAELPIQTKLSLVSLSIWS